MPNPGATKIARRCYIVPYFIVEGSGGSEGQNIPFNLDETDFFGRLRFFKKLWGFNVRYSPEVLMGLFFWGEFKPRNTGRQSPRIIVHFSECGTLNPCINLLVYSLLFYVAP